MKATYWRYAVIIVLPLAVYFGSTMYYTRTYYDRSLEWTELCLRQIDQTSVCNHLTLAADRAFSLSTDYYQPVIIMLIVAMTGFAGNNLQMRKELKELKEKLDA
jgi:hypothetical protein